MFPLAPPPFPPPSCSEDMAVWKLSSRKFPFREESGGRGTTEVTRIKTEGRREEAKVEERYMYEREVKFHQHSFTSALFL